MTAALPHLPLQQGSQWPEQGMIRGTECRLSLYRGRCKSWTSDWTRGLDYGMTFRLDAQHHIDYFQWTTSGYLSPREQTEHENISLFHCMKTEVRV